MVGLCPKQGFLLKVALMVPGLHPTLTLDWGRGPPFCARGNFVFFCSTITRIVLKKTQENDVVSILKMKAGTIPGLFLVIQTKKVHTM